MSATTAIEWTDSTWNPWIGCTRISPGCDHCYAAVSAPARTRGVIWGAKEVRQETGPKNWNLPKTWNRAAPAFLAEHGRRRRVFCASLADVFDNAVDQALRLRALHLMAECADIDWLVLTKRVGNVAGMVPLTWMEPGGWPAHIRIGSTIVNQTEADRDIPKLLALPCPNFLSMEPLLEPVELRGTGAFRMATTAIGAMTNTGWHQTGIHWVIVGGESGPGARPMHPDWARSLRDQCQAAGVPFLFKQWGEWLPTVREGDKVLLQFSHSGPTGPDQPEFHQWPDQAGAAKVGKKAAGRSLDGRQHDGYPESAA